MLLRKPERQRGYKKERILRVLLCHTDSEITKYRVAKEADVSEPWCREYTEKLEDRGLLRDTDVLDPTQLYEEWLDVRIDPGQTEVSLQNPEKILQETDLDHALTTYKAENLIQGFLFVSTTDFYVDPSETQGWQEIIEDRGLLGGGNTRIRITDEHIFYNSRTVNGFSVVSTPQLILDLLDEGGHSEQAAEKLIAKYHGED